MREHLSSHAFPCKIRRKPTATRTGEHAGPRRQPDYALTNMVAGPRGTANCTFYWSTIQQCSVFKQHDDDVPYYLVIHDVRSSRLLHELLATMEAYGFPWTITRSSNLRVLMDEIFARTFSMITVTWRSINNSNNDSKQVPFDHNYALIYPKIEGWETDKLGNAGHIRQAKVGKGYSLTGRRISSQPRNRESSL